MQKLFRFANIVIALSLVASLFISIAPVSAQTVHATHPVQLNANAKYVPGEVVVVFRGGKYAPAFNSMADNAARAVGGQIAKVSDKGDLLLSLPVNADVNAAVAQLRAQPGVLMAEPNYVYSLPNPSTKGSFNASNLRTIVIRRVRPSKATNGKSLVAEPIALLQSMMKNKTMAVYPNDPYLWWNGGWSWVGADIVSPNTTVSAQICEVDTGVDYTHPELLKSIVKGYDFVNNDADPMDDNGHGTHVAGIMAAAPNNKLGIAGVSTGKVVAVKGLGSQGWGTNFDIANAINYCANYLGVRVISMSLGGPESTLIHDAINYAVNTKGQLVVAAAGNDGKDTPEWPAFFANNDTSGSAACAPTCPTYPTLTDKVIAVAADGYIWQDSNGNWNVDYSCMADYSNFGSWVSVSAPGSWIYSTTPYDKPFWLNTNAGVNTRYDSLSGTSMATPFVAAAAARRWGYKPLESNTQIKYDVTNYSPTSLNTSGTNEDGGTCWDSSMSGKVDLNVADLLDRGAVSGALFDASTELPLNGATVGAYQGTTLTGSAIITPNTWTPASGGFYDPDPARIFTSYTQWTDVINLPVGGPDVNSICSSCGSATPYVIKGSKTGYAATPQPVFQQTGLQDIYWGWNWAGMSAIPPMSANFDLYTGWWITDPNTPTTASPDFSSNPADLDSNLWIPNQPNPQDASQPAPFIVGMEGDSFGYHEGDPTGALGFFPFARWLVDGGVDNCGGNCNWIRVEDIRIQNRALAHAPLAANTAQPYYPGHYTLMVTDYGQTVDQDGDGCGDNYGYGYNPSYDNTCGGVGTPGVPLLGAFMTPWVYVWQNGLIKSYVPFDGGNGPTMSVNADGTGCNAHWWKGVTINSGVTGTPTYTVENTCGDATPGAGAGFAGIAPYYSTVSSGRMGVLNVAKTR